LLGGVLPKWPTGFGVGDLDGQHHGDDRHRGFVSDEDGVGKNVLVEGDSSGRKDFLDQTLENGIGW
jgi:hypothetical protein